MAAPPAQEAVRPIGFQGQVASAGTPVQLPNKEVKLFSIRALRGNNGVMYFGDANVTSSTGFPLAPGDEYSLSAHADFGEKRINLGQFYVDAQVNGDAVQGIYIENT